MPVSYNPYLNPYYTPYPQQQQITPTTTANVLQTQSGANNGIIWVQGESGAKSYLVGAGSSALLMDSEQSRFYIKSTDTSGMPMPLRIFEYTEIKDEPVRSEQTNVNNFVTHDELERRLKELELKPKAKKGSEKDAESVV